MLRKTISAVLSAAMLSSCLGAICVSAAEETESLTQANIIDKLVLGDSE